MKNKKLKLLGSASAAAVALSLSPLVRAQTQATAGSYNQPSAGQAADSPTALPPSSSAQISTSAGASASGALRIAAKDESKHTAAKLAGKKVHGQDGAALGTVKDFLVDPHSGEVRFAVVSTGGMMGIGDKLHLVPFQQLQEADKGFTTSWTKQQLDQAPAVNEEQFEENRVALNGADQSNATDAMESNAASSGQLVRATKIKSHDVKANGTKIGSIEGIVIEPGSANAVALLEPTKDMTDTKQKFLVPLSRFTLSGKKGNDITTTLTRADFEAAAQYNSTASASTATRSDTEAALGTQQNQNVADATAGTAASSAYGETNSATSGAEQAQAAVKGPQTTSPLNAPSSQESSMAVNESSSAATQNSASSDQFDTSTSQTGNSSGFAQNTPAPAATSSTSSLSAAGSQEQQSSVAQSSMPSASSTSSADTNSFAAPGGQNEASNVAQNTSSAPATSSTSSASATESQDQQSNVAANDTSSTAGTTSVENRTNTPGLTPTGQTSADQNPQADPTLITAAEAIRHALDSDPEIGHADVRVTPQNGKIVLEGQVSSDELKSQVEKKAQAAANGAEIDSQLKVQ